jgi:hypothetical protein
MNPPGVLHARCRSVRDVTISESYAGASRRPAGTTGGMASARGESTLATRQAPEVTPSPARASQASSKPETPDRTLGLGVGRQQAARKRPVWVQVAAIGVLCAVLNLPGAACSQFCNERDRPGHRGALASGGPLGFGRHRLWSRHALPRVPGPGERSGGSVGEATQPVDPAREAISGGRNANLKPQQIAGAARER